MKHIIKGAIYRAERDKGLTYAEIGKKYGVSRQRVAQVCGRKQPNRFRYVTEKGCVYVNIRKWLNENKITNAELLRRLGYEKHNSNYMFVREILTKKREPKKSFIDKMIEITGLTYEELFMVKTENELEAESDSDEKG